MKKITLLTLLTLILSGCSTEDLPQDTIKNEEKGYKISPDQAVSSALSYMSLMFPETRSVQRSHYDITPLRRVTTRSPQNDVEYPDTLYYVINFSDDNGFALMGADRRLPRMLAISDTGNMNLADTVFNRGLAIFMENISTPYLPADALPENITRPVVSPPMLSVSVRKWGQRAPYNDECPIVNGLRTPTGCVPLAVGQVMTYFDHPASYGGTVFDWKKMKNGEDNATVAKLLRILGDKNNLAAEYGIDKTGKVTGEATGTDIDNIPRAFNNFGYDFNSIKEPLNRDFPYYILNCITTLNPHPVLLYGAGHQVVIGDEDDKNTHSTHVWVADGCMYQGGTYDDGTKYEEFYIHCVWGFEGMNNGYFLYTYNGVIGGKPDMLAPGDLRYDNEGYVYNKGLEGWTNFGPANK